MAFNMDQVVVKTEITDSENNFTCGGDQGESLMINAEVDDDVGAQRERHHDTQGEFYRKLGWCGCSIQQGWGGCYIQQDRGCCSNLNEYAYRIKISNKNM